MSYDIFISYRREGGFDTAALLCGRLKDAGYRVFFDVEALRSGRFNEALYAEIERCRDFIVVLTPNCLDRCQDKDDWVRLEVAHALAHGKNVVPILTRGFAFPRELPKDIDELRNCNGVTASQEFFDATLKKVRGFLHSTPSVLHRKLFKWGACGALVAGAVAAAVLSGSGKTKTGPQSPAVFPSTQAEKNLANQVLHDVGTHMQAANEEYKAFDAFLSECEAVGEPTQATLAQIKQSAEHLKKQLGDWTDAVKPLDPVTLGELRKTTVPVEDAVALATVPENASTEIKNALDVVCRVLDPQAPFDAQGRKKLFAAYRKGNDASARALWYGMCELLLSVDPAALNDYRQRWIPLLDFFQPARGQWSRDMTECKTQQDSALQVVQNSVTEIASVLGNLEQRNVTAEREQKAAQAQVFESVALCDEQYAVELARLDAILPSALSDEFMAVWTNRTAMVRDARAKHAALLVERVSGELAAAFKARAERGAQTMGVLADTVGRAGGTSNQMACAESVRSGFAGLATYEQRLLERLSAWKEARGAEAAQIALDGVSTARKILEVQIRLARLALCRFAWAVGYPQKDRLSAAHGGFDAVSPENMGTAQKALVDQWSELVKASAANVAQLKQQGKDLDGRLAAAYERLAKKATVTETDAPGIVWSKALIFLRIGRTEEALAAFDAFLKKQRSADKSDKGVDRYIAAARAYVRQRYPNEYVGGALVMGFAGNRAHSSLQVGDIVLAIDEHPVTTDDEFVALKKARAGQAIRMRILRASGDGALTETEVVHQADDPPVGVYSLKYAQE